MGPSSTIGHYRIVSKLGEGGMGAVYRAADTKLNREVAIKVLPDALANDPDYLERFTREAQVLASLNHPNIAAIYGVEDRAIVMELVEGETIAERIAGGPIPLEDALAIARQIAEALEAAHEKGIIHRDLKPANVKVTPDGVVKVLDFGLAKAADSGASASTVNSPTLTLRSTQVGVILGTAGYMAPEQAAGKPVDRRADIWSFGVTLYEMLTGSMLFTGETISHTLASVLKDKIDFDVPQAPPPIRRLLARCLERNPKERLRDIGEARIAIRDFLANPPAEAPPPAPAAPASRLPWIFAAALLLALAGSLGWNFRSSPPPPVIRIRHTLAEGQTFSNRRRTMLAISPDATQIAYVAGRRLYVRSLSELQGRPVAGAEGFEGVTNPVFSPDGKWLVYEDITAGALKRVPVGGGSPVSVCPANNPYGVSWTGETILFVEYARGVLQVPATGGQPEVVIPLKGTEMMADATLLPGGQAIIFAAADVGDRQGALGTWESSGEIFAQVLKTAERKILVKSGIAPRYSPTGHLLYDVNGVIYGVRFDARRLETSGTPVALVEGVARAPGISQFVLSPAGSIVYIAGPVNATGNGRDGLAITNRGAIVQALKVPPGSYAYPRISKNGKSVAYQVDDAKESSVWVWDLSGSAAPRRLTLPGSGSNRYPIWSAGGDRIAYQSNREGDLGIWWQAADGSGLPERITKPGQGDEHIPDSWAPDGRVFSFTEFKGNASAVWTYSLQDQKATVLAAEAGAQFGRSAFSPDGRWVAYQAYVPSQSRIYVRPFPATPTTYLAPSVKDSHHPAWSADGKELFFVSGPGVFGSMTVSTTPSVAFGTPVTGPAAFSTAHPSLVRTYDVVPEANRFIGVVSEAGQKGDGPATSEIQIVLNWFEELKQRVPVK
jgi:serine/threonine protein kinase/Tol biopolymer transport system component